MASRPKSGTTGNRRTTARSKKPATIDLEAKEVAPKEQSAASPPKADESKAKETHTAKSTTNAKSETTEAKPDTKPAGTQNTEGKKPAPSSPNAKTEQKDAPSDLPPVSKSGGGIVSALSGGLLAVLGLGVIGQFDGAKNLPLVGSLYGGGSEVTGAVSPEDISALQDKISELSAKQSIDLTPVNSKISELEGLIRSISEASAEGGSAADAATLSRIELLEAGIQELKAEIAASQTGIGGDGLSKAEFDTAIAGVNKRIDGVVAQGADSGKLDGVSEKLTDLSSTLSGLQSEVSRNSQQVAALNSQSAELENTVASVKASEQIAKSVAVNAVATALNNDDPLGLPISSLEALVGEMPETKRLAELARAGIPTIKELVSGLDAFSETLENPPGTDGDASLSDRFWANAQSLVSFRSTGPRDGDEPSAILSRVRAALQNGELSKAVSEWDGLPVEVQSSGASWKQRLDTRREAFSLYDAISSKLAAQAG